ncbi:MAG: DUF2802 domain-containing protein [Sedimenticola sp.]
MTGASIDMVVWVTAAVVGLLIFLLIVQWGRLKRLNQKLSETELRLNSLSENFNALCSGAVGVDQRVNRLEHRGRDIAHRQESIESHQYAERPYAEAIRLVHQGASVERLEEELGLSRSEADLVYMLHGEKEQTGI